MADDLSNDLASLRIDRSAPAPPSSARRVVVPAIVVVLLAAGSFAGYKRLEPMLYKQEVKTTEVLLVSPSQAEVTVTSTGYVVAQSTSKIGAKVPGRLAKVNVKEGDSVKAGDVIAIIEDADQKSAIAAAQSRVAVARARAETARANVAEVAMQVARERKLVESGTQGRASLENLEARQKALAEQVKAADAEAAASQAEVAQLSVGLKDRVIVAPISGTVVSKPASVGELVGLTSGGVGIGAVAEVADFASLLVETDVPEARLGLVKIGAPCEIVFDAYPQKRYRGAAVELGKKINRAKATAVVKVKIEGDSDGVLPDMSARVSFLSKAITDAALKESPRRMVALDAVADREGAPHLWTIEDGKLHKSPVKLGPVSGAQIELVDGPPTGTRIVAKPAPTLAEGQRIKEGE